MNDIYECACLAEFLNFFTSTDREGKMQRLQAAGTVFRRTAAIVAVGIMLGGCGATVDKRFSTMEPSQEDGVRSLFIPREMTVTMREGKDKTLKLGSRWDLIGLIEEGEIYRPINQQVVIDEADLGSACLVVTGEELVGFYSPQESAFIPLDGNYTLPPAPKRGE